jgi:hypothetical protein
MVHFVDINFAQIKVSEVLQAQKDFARQCGKAAAMLLSHVAQLQVLQA